MQSDTPSGSPYALFEFLPELAHRVSRAPLGSWPTPVEALELPDAFVKREDISAAEYGGNKIRPLELMFALARDRGAKRIWSTGAFGSNHAVAAAIHAPRAGLESGALLFPQPRSETGSENLRALCATDCEIIILNKITHFPFAYGKLALRSRRTGDMIMAPGAAVPLGALGHLSAGLELARQVEEGVSPAPRHVVVPVGSTCTTAGLIIAFELAARLGVGWSTPPHLHAVRVTPWPVTSPWRIASLASRTCKLLAQLGGPSLSLNVTTCLKRMTVHADQLGRGYGRPTPQGRAAIERFEVMGGPPLDTTYSAKAGAFFLEQRLRLDGPMLFWATKSSAPLPEASPERLAALPPRAQRWLV